MEISRSILLAFTQTYPGRISSTAGPQRPYPLFAARAPVKELRYERGENLLTSAQLLNAKYWVNYQPTSRRLS